MRLGYQQQLAEIARLYTPLLAALRAHLNQSQNNILSLGHPSWCRGMNRALKDMKAVSLLAARVQAPPMLAPSRQQLLAAISHLDAAADTLQGMMDAIGTGVLSVTDFAGRLVEATGHMNDAAARLADAPTAVDEWLLGTPRGD